ncbi:MAG: type II toxin-antitoxin system YhaV family toxin, partial [Candidatus Dormibacterales bacterium]
PEDPDRKEFRLEGELAMFRRVKKRGLPARYRLFYVFSSEAQAIIFLYLNDDRTLREEGARRDPYVVFTGLLRRGEIGGDFEKNYERWQAEHPGA